MIGIIGKILISLSFVSGLASLFVYFRSARYDDNKMLKIGNWLFGLKGLFLTAASALLIYMLFTHQFQYYYVFNYTSLDLQAKYLFSAFYGGQEGSFMIWIIFSWLFGFGLMKWVRDPFKAPVLFFMALTQVFLISMVLGWNIWDIKIGSSPFRTLAEEMPNAPFIQSNPNFIPTDGSGLNDLLKSPWMMVHPPILFTGFALMTIPYCFAMAALWKQKYNEWVGPALPWTLSANVILLTAIFLGGYWAYVTLSFGGYWAWDPVENASLVPWLIGTAGIHTMIIQRKSSVAQKSSILFAILAYVAVVYETFLTKSGILADSSVHSFTDLGLYNQLLIFMIVTTGVGIGLFFWRYKEMPSQEKESQILTREFMTFTGAMMLFILGLVIILGTSSPIIGLLFNENPTPPEISFYNQWSMPIAMIMAVLTVIGQYLFWKKYNLNSLITALLNPILLSSFATLAAVLFGEIRDPYYILYMFTAFFAVIGNSWIIIRLIMSNPKLIGGSVTHVGFGILLIGLLVSSVYNKPILDRQVTDYNERVKRGEVKDEMGFTVTEPVNFLHLDLKKPTIVNNKYIATYVGFELVEQNRPGQQTYKILMEPLDGGKPFYMYPEVYPMLTTSTRDNVQWSVDPDVRSGLLSDIYLYVAGSSYIKQRNNIIARKANANPVINPGDEDVPEEQTIKFEKGEIITVGGFEMNFIDYAMEDTTALPPNTNIGVRAQIQITHLASNQQFLIEPLFALYNDEEGNTFVFSPPVELPAYDITYTFSKVYPETGEIDLTINGLDEAYEDEWVLVVAEQKPLISVVWLGTFLLMIGFSISIFRHWGREKAKS